MKKSYNVIKRNPIGWLFVRVGSPVAGWAARRCSTNGALASCGGPDCGERRSTRHISELLCSQTPSEDLRDPKKINRFTGSKQQRLRVSSDHWSIHNNANGAFRLVHENGNRNTTLLMERCFLVECTEENELNMHKGIVSSQMRLKKANFDLILTLKMHLVYSMWINFHYKSLMNHY